MRHAVPGDTKLLVVGVRVFTKGAGRWLAIAASVAISAAMLHAQGTKTRCCLETPVAAPKTTVTNNAAPVPPAGAPTTASPAEVESLTALAPPTASAGQQFQLALPHSVGSEDRLQVKTIWAARAITVLFPQITTIYGYREDPLPWHPNGLAIDVMIPNYRTPQGIELGNQIAGYALANSKRWGINHVIWRQKIYPGVGGGNWMADLGSETADHYDHVHIATDGGGYPTGHETYYIASMTPPPPA